MAMAATARRWLRRRVMIETGTMMAATARLCLRRKSGWRPCGPLRCGGFTGHAVALLRLRNSVSLIYVALVVVRRTKCADVLCTAKLGKTGVITCI
eukprot:365384-Chlamydomonas_euryale.AAC.6